MGMELVPETSENLHILTRLSGRKNFIEHRHSSKMLKEAISFAAHIQYGLVIHKSAKEWTQICSTYLSVSCLTSVSSPTPISSHHLHLHSLFVSCLTFKVPWSERGWVGILKCVEILKEENNKPPVLLLDVIQQVFEAHWFARMTVLKLIYELTEVTQNDDKCSFI